VCALKYSYCSHGITFHYNLLFSLPIAMPLASPFFPPVLAPLYGSTESFEKASQKYGENLAKSKEPVVEATKIFSMKTVVGKLTTAI